MCQSMELQINFTGLKLHFNEPPENRLSKHLSFKVFMNVHGVSDPDIQSVYT